MITERLELDAQRDDYKTTGTKERILRNTINTMIKGKQYRYHAYFNRELKRKMFPSFRFSSKSKDLLASLPDVCIRAKLTMLMSSNLTNSAGLCTKMKPLSNGYK